MSKEEEHTIIADLIKRGLQAFDEHDLDATIDACTNLRDIGEEFFAEALEQRWEAQKAIEQEQDETVQSALNDANRSIVSQFQGL